MLNNYDRRFPKRTLVILLVVLFCALPSLAFMEFFGPEAMPHVSSWPAGLSELIEDTSRFAGSVGPIADFFTYHAGDTETLNAFVKKFTELKDATLRIAIERRDYVVQMKRYDGTDRTIVADWTMQVSEIYEGRPDHEKFKGKNIFIQLCINPTNKVRLKKLVIPNGLDVTVQDEFKDFMKRHDEQHEQESKK